MQTSLFPSVRDYKREGMKRAEDHAGEGWNVRALASVKAFLNSPRSRLNFMAEDIRAHAYENGLPKPPHERAWGGVMVKAIKAGWLRKIGIKQVENPKAHNANANLYVKL